MIVASIRIPPPSAVAGHVAKVGYDFAAAFEDGLDLILDALERRRAAG